MSTNAVNHTPATPTKPSPPMSSTHPTTAQAAAAFAAHLKKNQAEQLSRAMKHSRRDGVGRLLAADESGPGIAQLTSASDDAVEGIGHDQRGKQNQQDGQQAQHEGQQEGEQEGEQDGEQIRQRKKQQYDRREAQSIHIALYGSDLDTDDALATDALTDRLAPVTKDDGLFDVLHPDGSVLSVAVTHTPIRVSLLLSATSEGQNSQLRRCKMELEQRLGRRIGKDVVIAVL